MKNHPHEISWFYEISAIGMKLFPLKGEYHSRPACEWEGGLRLPPAPLHTQAGLDTARERKEKNDDKR